MSLKKASFEIRPWAITSNGDGKPRKKAVNRGGRTIRIDYCWGFPILMAEMLKQQLEEDIPGIDVQLQFNERPRRLRVREGRRDFYRAVGPLVPIRYIRSAGRNEIVNRVATYRYLPDGDDGADGDGDND